MIRHFNFDGLTYGYRKGKLGDYVFFARDNKMEKKLAIVKDEILVDILFVALKDLADREKINVAG